MLGEVQVQDMFESLPDEARQRGNIFVASKDTVLLVTDTAGWAFLFFKITKFSKPYYTMFRMEGCDKTFFQVAICDKMNALEDLIAFFSAYLSGQKDVEMLIKEVYSLYKMRIESDRLHIYTNDRQILRMLEKETINTFEDEIVVEGEVVDIAQAICDSARADIDKWLVDSTAPTQAEKEFAKRKYGLKFGHPRPLKHREKNYLNERNVLLNKIAALETLIKKAKNKK